MKLNPIKANMTELELPGSILVLFSYKTPVATIDSIGCAFKTSKKWSKTTSRHINQWLSNHTNIKELPQEHFDNLILGVK